MACYINFNHSSHKALAIVLGQKLPRYTDTQKEMEEGGHLYSEKGSPQTLAMIFSRYWKHLTSQPR